MGSGEERFSAWEKSFPVREKRVFVWGEVHPGLGELLLLAKEAFSESGERIVGRKEGSGRV